VEILPKSVRLPLQADAVKENHLKLTAKDRKVVSKRYIYVDIFIDILYTSKG
jgi:hypothetical protein